MQKNIVTLWPEPSPTTTLPWTTLLPPTLPQGDNGHPYLICCPGLPEEQNELKVACKFLTLRWGDHMACFAWVFPVQLLTVL